MSADRSDDTRIKIKNAARRLFAAHGIDSVSVRDILTASGQRNLSAIGYYFQNKDNLAREILIDGARLTEERRNALLDQLEARGGEIVLRDVLSIMVRSAIDLGDDPEAETYIRFFARFQQQNHGAIAEIIANRFDSGFRRCITHLRRLVTECPREILNERIRMMMLMVTATLSLRELVREYGGSEDLSQIFGGRAWTSETLLENLIDACEGIFRQPVSAATMSLLATETAKSSR